ncbi:histone acetyltransferase, putative [Plasmodium ovale wallikeri]|uniref:RNA cytidine acetyltransferase n=1 Tax=Plasmodium ovale wallikeri TaxID=864142 RepID=A0A1A8YMF4_PLAOA|nr:histone acetyltransferase, putative [Plasmodium ovale wallikeri]
MKKKVDGRVKTLVENCVALGERSMFLVVGDQGKNVVVNFYFLLNRLVSRTHEILWCYKKKLDFSTSKKKRFRELKKKIKKGTFDSTVDNNFDLFLKNANIRFCFYKDTQKILGKTYSICVMQDFSHITPNILCRCIETVIGGGIIIFLMIKVEELKDIYNLTLHYHKKYTMNGTCNVYNNYIHRFFLSLNTCKNAMFIDDEMNILPLNDNHLYIRKVTSDFSQNEKEEDRITTIIKDTENKLFSNGRSATLGGFLCHDKNIFQEKITFLESICEENEKRREEERLFLSSSKFINQGEKKNSKINLYNDHDNTTDRQPYGFLDRSVLGLLKLCLSVDQLDILLSMCKILRNDEEKKKNIKEVLINLMANRGRGKSATLGLLLSLSIYFNYSNIIVCSGNNDGVETVYEFLNKGLETLGYKEFKDFEMIYELGKIKEIIIFKNIKYLKQRIRHFNIVEDNILNCELMIIDEAACIPVHILKNKIKGEVTILSTTLNGYEGTGKTFTFKLVKQLKKKFITHLSFEDFKNMKFIYFDKAFIDISLNTPIRYSYNDKVETWLNNFLCLNCNETSPLKDSICSPSKCHPYFVNKNIFKNYNRTSENLLKKIMTLFITSHYKNTPNDLIMILDSQQHHLFIFINGNMDTNNLSPDDIDKIDIYGVLHCAIDGIIHPNRTKRLVKLDDIVRMVASAKGEEVTKGEEGTKGEEVTKGEEGTKGSARLEVSNPLGNDFEGNLIPYIISDHFQFYFYNYIGIRIVRISIHPSMQNLNYGSEFLRKVFNYYRLYNSRGKQGKGETGGDLTGGDADNGIHSNGGIHTSGGIHSSGGIHTSGGTSNGRGSADSRADAVLYRCTGPGAYLDQKLKKIDYLGTCFGLTKGLLIFWQKNEFIPVFLKQQKNDITGEYSILMLKCINDELKDVFINFYHDFVRMFRSLLPFAFKNLESFIVFNILRTNQAISLRHSGETASGFNGTMGTVGTNGENASISNRMTVTNRDDQSSFYNSDVPLDDDNIFYFFHPNDLCRLKRYVMEGRNFYEILYLMTTIANLILFKKIPIEMNFLEYTILYAISFQNKTCKEISDEIKINVNQTNAILRKILHRVYNFFQDIMERQVEREVNAELIEKLKKKKKHAHHVELPSGEYVDELEKNAHLVKKKQKREKLALMREFNLLSGTENRKKAKQKKVQLKTNSDRKLKKGNH